MKRYWVVLLTAATLASCQSNQPATNPFLRTTVTPPTTSSGVLVTPGQPYAQGISPPMVTQPAPVVTTPAPVTTQPVPVSPVAPPAVAPMATPPTVTPQGDQFRYPGGSFLFHQSSNDPPPEVPAANAVRLAGGIMPPGDASAPASVTQATYVQPAPIRVSGPMSPAPIIENPYVTAKASETGVASQEPRALRPDPSPSAAAPPVAQPLAQASPLPRQPVSKPLEPPVTAPTRLSLGTSRGDPPGPFSVTPHAEGNSLRIVGESSPPTTSPLVASSPTSQVALAPKMPFEPPSNSSVLRITAGAATPTVRTTVENAPASGQNLAVSTASSNGNVAKFVSPPEASHSNAVVQAAFQPAASGAASATFGHTPDYRTLRGRLEYSNSQRQWKLRYIPIDGQTDRYGGSVILVHSPALNDLKPGELVEVQGTLVDGASAGGFAPHYAIGKITRQTR